MDSLQSSPSLFLLKTPPKLFYVDENDGDNGIGRNESPKCRDTLSFKGKKSKKCTGKRKDTKETEEPGPDRGRTVVRPDCTVVHPTTTVRAHHHRQTLELSGSAVPRALRFGASFWSVGSTLDLLPWAYWASFVTLIF